MELKIRKDDYNQLLKRKEVYAEVAHDKGSPSRMALREAVAAKYGTKAENVYVIDIHSRTGTQQSDCEVEVYDDAVTAKQIVPQHVQIRNLPSEERKKVREQQAKKREEKPKAAPPPKKEEKKKEEKLKQEVKEEKAAPKEGKEPAAKESKEGKEPKQSIGKEHAAK